MGNLHHRITRPHECGGENAAKKTIYSVAAAVSGKNRVGIGCQLVVCLPLTPIRIFSLIRGA